MPSKKPKLVLIDSIRHKRKTKTALLPITQLYKFMRRFFNKLIIGSLLIGSGVLSAQTAFIDTVFFENFDGATVQGSIYSDTTLAGGTAWVQFDSIPAAPSSPNSYRSVADINPGRSYWETPVMDFTGLVYILFEFEHIAKIHSTDRGRIEYSIGGGPWTIMNATQGSNVVYLGESQNYPQNWYFNEGNYPPQLFPNPGDNWGGINHPIGSIPWPQSNWWRKEIFDMSGEFANQDSVVMRFNHDYTNVSQFNQIPPAYPGWFVDNVYVIGADCNLIPPEISFTLTPPVNYDNRPQGLQPCEGDYRVALDATDNLGIDSVQLFYRINNGPWVRRLMPNISGDRYVDTIPNLVTNDSVDWYVVAWDSACPNNTRRPVNPNDYYSFWIGDQIPTKCANGPTNNNYWACGGTTVPFIQQTLPWVEDFQGTEWVPGTGSGVSGSSHRGGMPIGQGEDWGVFPLLNIGSFGWSVRSGATPTNLTGPSVDNTIGGPGGKYVFAAAMQGSGFQQTLLTTPCIVVPDDSCLYAEFFYYMYGQNVQELRLDIDTGADSQVWVDGIWQLSGEQQTSDDQPWRRAYVDLAPYIGGGKTIRLRWRATKLGTQPRADIAIDDIRVDFAPAVDFEAELLTEPIGIGCGFGPNENVTMMVRNLGCQTATNIPVAYNVNGGAPVWDTIPGPLAQGDTIMFTFGSGVNLTTVGTYDIKAWTAISGDANNSNDTTNTVTVISEPVINTFPHVLDFDGPGNTPGNGTFATPGNISTTDWDRIPDPTAPGASGYAFMVGEGMTPTVGTGPFTDVSGFGNYLYAEGNFGNVSTPAIFESRCFDVSSLANPVFDLWYHGYVASGTFDSLCVNFLPQGARSWQTPPGGRITSFTQNDELSPWTYRKFDLSSYNADQIKIRVVAYRRSAGDRCDVAIDNLAVYNELTQDAGIVNIQPPGLALPLAVNPLPTIHIRNYGSSNLTSVPIEFTVTPLCGPNQGTPTTYNATATVNIAPGNVGTFQFPASANIVWPEGRFEICATTNVAGDVNTFNDSWCKYTTGFGTKTIPYFDDFDDCDHSSNGWFSQGGKQNWEVGNPSFGINQAASQPNAFFTNLSGPYYPGTEEYLRLPLINGFDTIEGAIIQFSQFQAGPNSHGGRLETFEAGQWLRLGSVDAANVGTNWHSQPPFGIASTPLFNGPAWVNATQGWINSSYPLFDYNYLTGNLQLRFHWKSTTTGTPGAGWGIDNFEILVPPQNSAAPIEVRARDNLVFPFRDQEIIVRIQNTGAKPLDSCKLAISLDNGATWEPEYWFDFDPPLRANQSRWVTYPEIWPSVAPGNYDVCAATSRPNNKQDNFPADDTLCGLVQTLPEIDLSQETNNEYCNDFEDSTAFNFQATTTEYDALMTTWELGNPNLPPITSPYSGNNAWMTDLNNDYIPQDKSILVTPVFIIDSINTTYEVSFWHNFKTELLHDGGNFEYSQDGGITWGVLGDNNPNRPDTTLNWYNQPFIWALDQIRPGWSGNSNGWRQSKFKFCFEFGGQTVFRFRFGSDNNVEDVGWAIDDFCMREVNESCDFLVSTQEFIDEDGIMIGTPVPNPAQAHTYIAYSLPRPGDMRVRVSNLLGQKLFEEIEHKQTGRSQTNFDVSTWTNGVYIITIEYEGNTYTSKLIVQN